MSMVGARPVPLMEHCEKHELFDIRTKKPIANLSIILTERRDFFQGICHFTLLDDGRILPLTNYLIVFYPSNSPTKSFDFIEDGVSGCGLLKRFLISTIQFPSKSIPPKTSLTEYMTFENLAPGLPNGDPATAIPEPSTLLLLGTGLAGLAGLRRRKG
jgi:hypothetical protein